MDSNQVLTALPYEKETLTYTKASKRLEAMDVQRGTIMMLMAFSHAREYVSGDRYSNLTFNQSPAWHGNIWPDLIQQIFISTVAAGGFFMMMGIGMVFLFYSRLKDGWPLEKICFYFIKRGALLVLIQLTLLQCFEWIASRELFFYAGVLLSLGIDMILAALCLYAIQKLKHLTSINSIKYFFPLVLILFISIFMQVFFNRIHNTTLPSSLLTNLFLLCDKFYLHGIKFEINFTPLPWFPAVAFGLIAGELFHTYKEKTLKTALYLSLMLLFLWLAVTTGNLFNLFHFGSYKFLAANESVTFASYFGMSKYPPSLTYFLWAMGVNLFFIFLWQVMEKNLPVLFNIVNPIKIFGQCALFFFIMHWFIYYGISLFLPAYVSSVSSIAALWLLGLIPLYFMCKQYYQFKSQKPAGSFWRMF